MALKLKGVKNAFKDTRSRTLFIVLVAILLIAAIFAILSLRKTGPKGVPAAVSLKTTPDIESVPGTGNPPREYVQLQQEENLLKAEQAAKTGKDAIPTITRSSYLSPTEFQTPGTSATPGCSVEELRRARAAGVRAEELRCKGCSAAELRAAGFTAGDLMNAGFSAKDLLAAGYTPAELRAAGYTAAELVRAGASPDSLAAAGYNAAELSQAGIGPQQLQASGLSADQLRAAGIGVPLAGNLPKNCNIDSLTKARNAGVSASQLRKMGCSAAALRAAGYTAAELKAAGFNAQELKDAGFGANDLRNAGFTAGELRGAGFAAGDLKAAGYDAKSLRSGGFNADELNNAGFGSNELANAGYSNGDLIRAGLSTPTTQQQPASTIQPVSSDTLAAVPAITSTEDSTTAAIERLQQRQTAQLSAQQRQELLQQLQTAMTTQANELFASWTPPPTQQYITSQQDNNGDKSGQNQGNSGANKAQPPINPADIIKAGSVLFAVLDTGINSDEQSPVMATIVQGRLKGSKLIGGFDRVDKKVVLRFNTINIPNMPTSIKMDAVAIDSNTARTALASDVDNHYLLRYGTLFASAFLSGLGTAIGQSGSTQVTGPLGVGYTQYPVLNTRQQVEVALGQVGTQYANRLSNNFTKPPTVTVDAGSGIGILFMSDLNLKPSS